MKFELFPANRRGVKDAGWLKSNFFFSFSDYCNPIRSAFGTLVAFNDDYLLPGKGFGTHPHINMEIISVMLRGKMNHKDSLGYSNEVVEGSVQIMSAGSGLYHEEYNIGDEDVNFLQIWIQPKLQNIRPRYQFRHFPKSNRLNELVTVVSHEEGLEHCWINQNAKISLGYYDVPGSVEYSYRSTNKACFLFLIEGSMQINEEINLAKRDAAGIWDTEALHMQFKAPTEFLLIETVVNQK